MPQSLVEKQIRKDLRYNVVVNMADAVFFGAALGFGSFGTIIPLFVSQLTTSATLIGLVPAIHAVGWQLPQLFTANKVSSLRRYKPFVLVMTINERLPFIGFALVAWFMVSLGPQTTLILTFLLLIWQGFGGGFTANAWQSLIAKIIPAEFRGTFFGGQAAAANVFISLCAIGAGFLLEKVYSPLNFTLTFLIAFFFLVISWFALALSREPEDTEKVIPEKLPPIWQGSSEILKRDRNFAWFLATRLLSMVATVGFTFYIIYCLRYFNMSAVTAGFLTATLTISQTVANAGMGWLGDRWGHRTMLILGLFAVSLSSGLAWFAPSLPWFYLVFILAGVANVSIWTIGMAMTVEFGTETERPVYIGLSNTLVAPVTILAPILGGWIADTMGFKTTFAISVFVGLFTAGVLWLFVKDPRHIAPLPPIEEYG
jgi:MFS family permease